MSGHTPGPWSIAPCSDTHEIRNIVTDYREERGKKIANWIAELDASIDFDLSDEENSAAMETMRANANLIAAAPDLLDALRGMVGLIQLIQSREPALVTSHRFIAAEQAIARAEGRS